MIDDGYAGPIVHSPVWPDPNDWKRADNVYSNPTSFLHRLTRMKRSLGALILIILASCSSPSCRMPLEKGSMAKPAMAEVNVLWLPSIIITNPTQIKRLRNWLVDVEFNQVPLEEIGEVAPWCTIKFFAPPN